ncbi:cysteine repeat modular protein 2, putative [Plasmodium vinckei]|uniref:Cysteine repeat modular protein 2, putative n=1 Tax=Plasmodium vinckei TaxID=5860 RepID=A0A6V7SPP0_PLAVN|nr:cysteine repeat modular protein 2, putative [Plasmodium vinckei]
MMNPNNFLFLLSILACYLFLEQRTTSEFSKQNHHPKGGYRNSNIHKNDPVKSNNLNHKNKVKNLFKKTTKLINERGISFVYVSLDNILELKSNSPISLINTIYSKEKEKYLSECYIDGKAKNIDNCNRFTLSGNICDAPVDFDVNNNFALNTQNKDYSTCLSDNKPEYRIKERNHIVIQSGEKLDLKIKNESFLLRTSIIITEDNCLNKVKTKSPHFIFQKTENKFGIPILYKGHVIGSQFQNIKVSNDAEGLFNVCSCIIDYLYYSYNKCSSNNKHYSEVLTIRVIKKPANGGNNTKKIKTGEKYSVNLEEYVTPFPIKNAFIIKNIEGYTCNNIKNIPYNEMHEHFYKNEKKMHFYDIFTHETDSRIFKDDIVFQTPGDYLLCYTSNDGQVDYSALLSPILVIGYDLNKMNYIYIDLNLPKLNIEHSVVLQKYNSNETLKDIFFKKKESIECSGENVTYSNNISEINSDNDKNLILDVIHISNIQCDEYDVILEICSKYNDNKDDKYKLIGHVIIKPYILHSNYDINHLACFNIEPDDIQVYTMNKESEFFIFFPELLENFNKYDITYLYISSLSYTNKNEIILTYNHDKNMTPIFFKYFKISNPSSSILYITKDSIKLYVLKKPNKSLYLYDITPEKVDNKKKAINSNNLDDPYIDILLSYYLDYADFIKCENCLDPIMMKPIYDENKLLKNIFLLTSHPYDKFLIINLDFSIIYTHNINDVKNEVLQVRDISFSLNILEHGSFFISDISCGIFKNESLDCFLIDQLNNTVLGIEYIQMYNKIILIDTFQGKNVTHIEENKLHDSMLNQLDTYLYKPQNIVVYPYYDSYVIFINEDESNELILMHYDKQKKNNNFSYIGKIDNTHIDIGKIRNVYKFYDYKDLINRNILLIIRYYERNIQFIYIPIRNILSFLELKYNHPSVIQDNGQMYVLKIISDEIQKMNIPHNFQIIVHNINKSQYVTIDRYDGTVQIKLSEFVADPVNLTVELRGVFAELKINIEFTVICADGMKAVNGNCVACPLGSYNNINEYIKNKTIYECTSCHENSTTKYEASILISQCLCLPGYELNDNDECVLCAKGTWKPDLSNTPCIFHCYPNSYSLIEGSKGEEESMCKCNKGFYFVSKDSINFCEECDIGYFCPGGYKVGKTKCPENTTNTTQQNDSIKSCECEKGYEPFDSSGLINYNFIENPIFNDYKNFTHELQSSQVCVPCKVGFYKSTVSDAKCTQCSPHVYTVEEKSTSIFNCNKCEKGYYLHTQDSCLLCPDNHYCPGGENNNAKNGNYENEKVPCSVRSLTIPPNELNISDLNCLCKKGFEFGKLEGNEFDCLEIPKNYYKPTISNTKKQSCPENSVTLYTKTESKSKCICMEGYYWDIQEYKCIKCPKGYYCPGGYLKNCFTKNTLHLCKPQKIICPIKNSTTQDDKPFSESSCMCDKGYTINKESLGECVLCPVNTYKDVISNVECTMCLAPYTTDGQIGSTKEEDCTCSGGYYFFNHCLPCSDKDTYCKGGKMIVNNKRKTVHYAPSKCLPNTVISFETEKPYDSSFCVCKKGYKHVYTANNFIKICAPCESGFFKTIIGDFTCESKCKPNSTSFYGSTHETHCFCLENYYFKNGICINCPDGAHCRGGFEEETLLNMKKDENYLDHSKIKHVMPVPRENYALYRLKANIYNYDWFIVECSIKDACLYNGKCHESMTNFLCGECKKGYTNNFSKLNLCIKCSGMIANILRILFVNIIAMLFIVIMAYLNVFAGANRKSVHSIVIKIAINYFSCMKLFYIIGTSEMYFPINLSSHVNYMTKYIKKLFKVKKNYGLYCILTSFNMSHANAYFYGMLYYGFKPILFVMVLTILMYIVVEMYKYKVRDKTNIKLRVIDEIKLLGNNKLYDEIMQELISERGLVLFRYIPIPGDSRFKRIKKFLEDMIPIHVTLLFFVHTQITYYMLSLLDCKAIYYNDKFIEQYMSFAPSVKCGLSKDYAKFFILGISGLIVWGIGIPLVFYLLLYKNRRKLHNENVLLKYGFLNNGYNFQFWYWETVVFLRKKMILLISTVSLLKTNRVLGTTMWLFTCVSSFFLVLQLIFQPFDSRNYRILNKLETFSMVTWTISLMILTFLTVSSASSTVNFYVLLSLLFFNFIFMANVLIALCYSYMENLSHIKKSIKIPFLRKIFENMSKIAEEKCYKEPIVSLNPHDNSIEFTKKYKKPLLFGKHILTNEEKCYFLNVLSNFIYFGILNLNFNVFHSYFMEFMLRLSIIDNELLQKKTKSGLLKLIAKEPQSIDEWIKLKECELKKRTFFERHKKILNLFTNNSFIIQNNIKNIIYKGDKHTIISDYEILINVLKYDKDFITDFNFLYDEDAAKSGLILSDLQLSFTKIKMKDKELIMQLFSIFIAKKNIVQFERDIHLKNKIEQLKLLYETLIKPIEKKKLTFRKNVEDAVKGDKFDYKIIENELILLNNRINTLIDNYQKLKNDIYGEVECNPNDNLILNDNNSENFDSNLIKLNFKEVSNDDEPEENMINEDVKDNVEENKNDDKSQDGIQNI